MAKEIKKTDNNFALLVIAIVAIVGIVGILNFNGATGNVTGPVKLNSGEYVWCDAVACKDANNKVCTEFSGGSEAPCGYNMATSDGSRTYSVYYKP